MGILGLAGNKVDRKYGVCPYVVYDAGPVLVAWSGDYSDYRWRCRRCRLLPLASILHSWVPSDISLADMIAAIEIKAGLVPWEGVHSITKLHERFPKLGLHKEDQIVEQYVLEHMETYAKPVWCLTREEKDQWCCFYKAGGAVGGYEELLARQ